MPASSHPAQRHPVTVVVPVYGDIPSLTACVEALIETVDQAVHRVLLVNDCGPEADAIEELLTTLIAGQPSFRYERNPRNLGFVGNCNRAVLELDQTDNDVLLLNSDTIPTADFIEELTAVLYASEQNGAVCARSNNATIASLPYKLRDPSVGRAPERTRAVHRELKDLLPSSSVAPVAMGFCLLIRRTLIARFGLFDEAFSPGYGEENDFCLRIAAEGYRSLIAHRALVLHVGSRSFSRGRRDTLRSAHERLLVSRYPHYPDAVREYIFVGRDAVDVFADALAVADDVRTVLIDVTDTGPHTAALIAAARTVSGPTRFTIAASGKGLGFALRHAAGIPVVDHDELDGQWDLAISCATALTAERSTALNRTSLRWVLASPNGAESTVPPFVDAVVALDGLGTSTALSALVDRHGRGESI